MSSDTSADGTEQSWQGKVREAIESADVGDTIRVHLETDKPGMSSLSPEKNDIEVKEENWYQHVTMFGDPINWRSDGELVEDVLENEHAYAIEVL